MKLNLIIQCNNNCLKMKLNLIIRCNNNCLKMGITQSVENASSSLNVRLSNIVKNWYNNRSDTILYSWDRCKYCNRLNRIEVEQDESIIQSEPILTSYCNSCHNIRRYHSS